MKARWSWGALMCVSLLALAGAQTPSNRFKSLVQQVVPSIVTVRAVVKIDVKSKEDSSSEEIKFSQRGAVISEDGIIMMSSALLTSESLKQLLNLDPEDADKVDIKISPQSFKIIFERESQEYEAKLVATDSQLGLAFLKIENLQGRTLKPIVFKDSPLEIGSELFCVTRMPKGYDFTPYLVKLVVVAEVDKPRRAYLTDRSTDELGLPVFNAEGVAVGVVTTIRPTVVNPDEEDLGFDSGASESILPIAVVQSVINQAIQRARSQ